MQLGRLESYYEELFAEVIEDGVITADERARLELACAPGMELLRRFS